MNVARLRYWLVKSEPDEYSIDDLAREPGGVTCWDGIRNYQARNFMRDEMAPGDRVLFYHSSCPEPGVAGAAEVARAAYADPTQFDPESRGYDPRSDAGAPRWIAVDLRLSARFQRFVPLAELRRTAGLEKMTLLRRGNRLSVMPVSPSEWRIIERLGSRAR